MVAIRKKVGARGDIRTKPLAKGKKTIKIDCSIPANDGILTPELVQAFEQFMQQNTKLNGQKGKLGEKVKVSMDETHNLTIVTTMQYRKKYFKYLTKKFLKKKNLRDWLRILAPNKGAYQLRYFNIHDQEEAQ